MDKVLQYLQEFKPQSRAWFDEQRQVAEDYEFFREFSKRENLEKAEWRDFQQVGSHLNCFRSLALAKGNALGRPNHPIERYRASFVYLVHGPEPLAERIRNFHTNDEYSLHYFGDAALSELVGYLFPEQFIFYNSRDKFSAGFLDIEPHFETGDDFVEKLVKFSQAIRPVAALYEKTIGQQTDLPLNLEVDQFLSWVYEVYSSDQNPLEAKYWVLGAGKGAKRWPEFYEDGIVTIGWDGLGDLRLYNSQSEVFDAFKTKYKDESNPTNNAKACFDFAHKLRIGDGLFVKQGTSKLVGFGVIESEYMFDESRPSHKHIRKVRWTKKGEFDLPEGERLSIKTVTPVRDAEVLEMLKTTVGLEVDEEVSVSDSHADGVSYWWLNANPKIWNFAEDAVGQKQTYTTHNDQGNKRQKYKYFVEAKPGDLVIGYVTSPDREVVAVCKITKGIHQHPDGESIEFEKIMQLTTPVPLEELQRNPSLQESEPLVNNYGSLFRLTSDEFAIIRGLIDDANPPSPLKPSSFTMKDALDEVFVSEPQFHLMLDSLTEKKNVILQGSPGVGKTFIARRLAYALMGEEDCSRLGWIQFHQSYSYEDFIQGFRPTSNGHFELKNGIFYQFCRRAQRDSISRRWVFVIDEINRGNLSKIFGELMMLLEPDKRGKTFAMPLAYSKTHDETFFVPENVHLIGLMNTADRSLAMVDYALRRRFRFLTIAPAFGSEGFRQHLRDKKAEDRLAEKIIQRFTELNLQIAGDEKNLGAGYQIGHSYFCVADSVVPDEEWYRRIIELEITPLLEEYWLDDQSKIGSLVDRLLE